MPFMDHYVKLKVASLPGVRNQRIKRVLRKYWHVSVYLRCLQRLRLDLLLNCSHHTSPTAR